LSKGNISISKNRLYDRWVEIITLNDSRHIIVDDVNSFMYESAFHDVGKVIDEICVRFSRMIKISVTMEKSSTASRVVAEKASLKFIPLQGWYIRNVVSRRVKNMR